MHLPSKFFTHLSEVVHFVEMLPMEIWELSWQAWRVADANPGSIDTGASKSTVSGTVDEFDECFEFVGLNLFLWIVMSSMQWRQWFYNYIIKR